MVQGGFSRGGVSGHMPYAAVLVAGNLCMQRPLSAQPMAMVAVAPVASSLSA